MQNLICLHVGKFYYPAKGGMEDHIYSLCTELKNRHNLDVKVLVANKCIHTVAEVMDGVEVTRAANLMEIFSCSICPTMPFLMLKYNPNIIHLHLPNPIAHFSYLVFCLIRKSKAKLVISWHSEIVKQKFLLFFYKPLLLLLLRKADHIYVAAPNNISNSLFLRRFKDKIHIIPYGVNIGRFDIAAEKNGAISHIREKFGKNILLFVGRLTYYKGLDYLIRAMRRICGKLIIIGEGKLKANLISLSRNLGLERNIFFLGEVSRDDIKFYYSACDIFVLPSIEKSEAFGIVQLEAMACRKPIVSTRLGTGVDWVNENDKTGITVEPKNEEALASAINVLLNSPDLRKKYGENGRRKAEESFRLEMASENVFSAYQKLFE